MEEQRQIRDARDGSETAWVALVHRYEEEVFRLAYLLLGNADEAKDVAQETFVRAFRSLHQFDLERPLRPWLLQITKNLARNRLRSLRRYLSAFERWLRENSAAHEASGGFETRTAEAELVWQAVRRLRQTDQEIIYLRYFLGFSVAETAETLSVAEGTVKSRHARALDRLRSIIEIEFPELAEVEVAQ